jgi:hypothetical protein
MHCSSCGADLPDGSTFCPACGTAANTAQATVVPVKPKRKFGCLAIAGMIIVGIFVLGLLMPKTNNNSSDSNSSDASVSTADLPLAVTAAELYNAYDKNEASAQNYFGMQQLLVSGVVEKVTLDFTDDPVVLLKTPNHFMSAQAALADEAKSDGAKLNPGDEVKLLCKHVTELAGTPMLKQCRVAPPGQKSQPAQIPK